MDKNKLLILLLFGGIDKNQSVAVNMRFYSWILAEWKRHEFLPLMSGNRRSALLTDSAVFPVERMRTWIETKVTWRYLLIFLQKYRFMRMEGANASQPWWKFWFSNIRSYQTAPLTSGFDKVNFDGGKRDSNQERTENIRKKLSLLK